MGDFKQEELDGWIKKYFGAIPKPADKIPRVTVKEPERKQDKIETSFSAKAPLPAIALTYLLPSVRSKDAPALSLAEEILSGGDSSRLYQALVYEQQSRRPLPAAPISAKIWGCSFSAWSSLVESRSPRPRNR